MSHRMKRSTALLMGGILLAMPARAQQPTRASESRAQVLVLGTFHFDNPGLDVVKSEIGDVLTPAKQAEIDEVLRGLARFNPTKIAVEVRAHRAPRLDSLYAAYRAGEHALGRSEVQQLGFRLAERFGHSQLHAIDHEGDFPFGSLMEYAQEHDPAFAERIQRVIAGIAEERNRMHREETIGEILRQDNAPESVAWGHGMYVGLARVGAGDTYVGADLLAKWYERNIRIFSDVQRIAEPGDRILVVFGAGHAAILRELVASDPALELVDATAYLGGSQARDER